MPNGLTPEQLAFVQHDPHNPARMLAGPGTGKSRTCVEYLAKLVEQDDKLRVKMLTFTRAATKEFTDKLTAAEIAGRVLTPSTVHGFALSVLMHLTDANIPRPIRIPDVWETKNLIHPHLSRLLTDQGHKVTPSEVSSLELSMAAGWQALDPAHAPIPADNPLRQAYQGQWERHRRIFAYLLLAELPYQAKVAVENFDPTDYGVDLLLVDEYQDLNAADIGLLKALAANGVTIVAIGDDDQSIYSWRQAAPQGIRDFQNEFGARDDYPLTVSQRCGTHILTVAQAVIAKATDRPAKQALTPRDGAPTGTIHLLRFANGDIEANGVANIIARRVELGVAPSDIAVLVRSSLPAWTKPLKNALQERAINLSSIDWVAEALGHEVFRRGRAMALLAVDLSDSLAWWSLMHLERGIGPALPASIYNDVRARETFAQALQRITETSDHSLANGKVKRLTLFRTNVTESLTSFDPASAELGQYGWGGWLLERLVYPTEEIKRVLEMVGEYLISSDGKIDRETGADSLRTFLGQIEPIAKDLAAGQADGVRIMTMAASKGLTVNTAIVMGVDREIVPLPRATDEEEERRLLYVALTRATDMCIMTFARRRYGAQGMLGGANQGQRMPSEFLSGVIEAEDGLTAIARL
jgi:DNA helicase II / ATP-dependent DNA helicase PcrA